MFDESKVIATIYRDEQTGELSLKWKDSRFNLSLETFCTSPVTGKDEDDAKDFFQKLREDGIL